MKSYTADRKLIEVLLKQGFIETSSKEEITRDKKSFKLSKQARKEIHFDHDIEVRNTYISSGKSVVTETELKLMLLYFKLKAIDWKEFESSVEFDLKKTEETLGKLENELEHLERYKVHKPRQNKIKRILDTYNNILN
jgi:hypothetical protein